MKILRDQDDLAAAFGMPYHVTREGLEPDPQWVMNNLVYVPLPTPLHSMTRVRVNIALKAQVENTLAELVQRGLWHFFHTCEGGWACRRIAGSSKASFHAWGAAIDFNASEMPRGSTKHWPVMVTVTWARHGWVCGQNWKNPDAMHWQISKIYP